MKIRTGFVSNSSSSSFIILGNKIKLEDFKETILKSLSKEDLDKIEETIKHYDYDKLENLSDLDFFEVVNSTELSFNVFKEENTISYGKMIAYGDDLEFGSLNDIKISEDLVGKTLIFGSDY